MITFLQFVNEIREKLAQDRPFKKYMSDGNKNVNLEFYECDEPSVTYKIDKITYSEIKTLITK